MGPTDLRLALWADSANRRRPTLQTSRPSPRPDRRRPLDWRELSRALRATFGHMPRLFAMVWATSRRLTLAVSAITVVQALIPAATIWVTKLLVDAVVDAIAAGGSEDSIRTVVALVLVQLVLAAAGAALQHGGGAVRAMLGDRFSNRLNLLILEKSESLDLSYFENPSFYDTLENARREANFRPVGVLTQVFQLGGSFIRLLSVVALLAALAWWILLVVLLTSIPYLATEFRFARRNYWMQTRRAPESRLLWYLSYVMTSDETVKEVRLFDLGSHLLQRYRDTFAKFYRENRSLTLRRESVAFVLALVSAGASAGVYVFVALGTIAGRLTLGDLTLFHQAFVQTQTQIQAIFSSIASIYESNLFLTNLFRFMQFEPRISADGGRPVPRPLREGFELRNVSFSYPGTRERVLRGLSLTIRPNETVALVGANGAGKTTIVKLLTRLYDPDEGRVLLDGVDMRDYDVDGVRRQVGAIFQDFVQYHATAGDNVGYGSLPDKDDRARVRQAAVRGGADPLIESLPKSYDTMLGRWWGDGTELSGGEWQKIALSRGYMRNAQLLILDEPTSSLDARSEYEVFQKFRDLTRDRMAVLISHRFSTVRMADRIYVIEDGQVSEQGTHEELMARGTTYATWFGMQARAYR